MVWRFCGLWLWSVVVGCGCSCGGHGMCTAYWVEGKLCCWCVVLLRWGLWRPSIMAPSPSPSRLRLFSSPSQQAVVLRSAKVGCCHGPRCLLPGVGAGAYLKCSMHLTTFHWPHLIKQVAQHFRLDVSAWPACQARMDVVDCSTLGSNGCTTACWCLCTHSRRAALSLLEGCSRDITARVEQEEQQLCYTLSHYA